MTSILHNTRRPDVTFHPDGRIDITARVAKILQLQKGDVIDVALSYGEYLLYVRLRADQCTGRHEAAAFPTNKGKTACHNYRAHSSRLCRAIVKEVFANGNSRTAKLPAGSPVIFGPNGTAIPLITKNPL